MNDPIAASARSPLGRRVAFGVLGVALVTILCLALLEVGLRVYCSVKPNADVEFFRYANLMKGNASDAGIGFMHRPGSRLELFGVDVEINRRGFRDAEYSRDPAPGTTRVALLGDSVTFGWGVAYGSRFSEILATEWSRSDPFEVMNTGHGNYNTEQELAMLREVLAEDRLDGVIQAWYINDAEPTPEHREPPWYSHLYLSIFLWSKTDLVQRRFGQRPSYVEYYRDLYKAGSPGLERFERALEGIAQQTRERDIPWIFVVLPEFHDLREESPFAEIYDRVGKAAAEAGAIVVDTTASFLGEDPSRIWVAYNDVHPNARGHAMIAKAILQSVDPEIFRAKSRGQS